jgi:prepilin-type N-terminal cleavage/methylation domain-containing protein
VQRARRRQDGFTLIEIVIATAILGILSVMLMQMIQRWSAMAVHAAFKEQRHAAEADLRRLAALVQARGPKDGAWPALGPWPVPMPLHGAVPWPRPAPGFDDLGWAPSTSPTKLQYRVEGWATGFEVSAIGDIDMDGSLEMYRINELGMYEGPLPWPPASVGPIGP